MFQYIVKRLALMVVTLFGITIVTFLVTRLAPGDPLDCELFPVVWPRPERATNRGS